MSSEFSCKAITIFFFAYEAKELHYSNRCTCAPKISCNYYMLSRAQMLVTTRTLVLVSSERISL